MRNSSAHPSAPPEYLDDHPYKIKKNPLFDISDFNCINRDPEEQSSKVLLITAKLCLFRQESKFVWKNFFTMTMTKIVIVIQKRW